MVDVPCLGEWEGPIPVLDLQADFEISAMSMFPTYNLNASPMELTKNIVWRLLWNSIFFNILNKWKACSPYNYWSDNLQIQSAD